MHCPKFGATTVVALPLLKPKDFESRDDYRLQLGFDNERLVTSWLQIIGRRAPPAPMIAVELVRSGDALVGVTAKVQAMPSWDTQAEKVQKEFADPTIWPKHLPVSHCLPLFRCIGSFCSLGCTALYSSVLNQLYVLFSFSLRRSCTHGRFGMKLIQTGDW
jgi:hypothetical protein